MFGFQFFTQLFYVRNLGRVVGQINFAVRYSIIPSLIYIVQVYTANHTEKKLIQIFKKQGKVFWIVKPTLR